MREDVQRRREEEGPQSPGSDQPDLQNHKPGSKNDRNQDPSVNH